MSETTRDLATEIREARKDVEAKRRAAAAWGYWSDADPEDLGRALATLAGAEARLK